MMIIPQVDYVIDDGGNTMGYVARGHITAEQMELAVRNHGWDDFELNGMQVDHDIVRCIPTPHEEAYVFRYEPSKPGRGAFKATFVWL